MDVAENISLQPLSVIHHFPFDVLKITGNESVDFLQRISTNEFKDFMAGEIQKTLLVTDKGRILDAVWVIHRRDHLLMFTSKDMSSDIISFLNKYIIMEDIVISDVSTEFYIDLHFAHLPNFYQTDYYGFPVSFDVQSSANSSSELTKSMFNFEQWRIVHGIPVSKKEILQDFNPLELNLWDWISFTKGCYIGQEVIARLDTYNKIQRRLCRVTSQEHIAEQERLIDNAGSEIGKLTSVMRTDSGFIALAIVKMKSAVEQQRLIVQGSNAMIMIEKVFTKEGYGRN